MRLEVLTLTGTTDGSGDATVSTEGVAGRIEFVTLDIDALTAGSNTIDLDTATTAQKIVDLAATATNTTIYPRHTVQTNADADITYDGTNEVYEPYYVFNEALTLTITGAGADEEFTVTIGICRSF